jgi:hypothetical protein
MTRRPNPVDLTFAELDLIRDLQAGIHRVPNDDPIWDALEQLGLVRMQQAQAREPSRHGLTHVGLRYRTD